MTGGPAAITNILIVGVGGQGTILAGELLANVLMEAGYDVKKSEVHGMAQRGGRVEAHVRFGGKVHSPLISPGEVDYLVGFEIAETLRSASWLAGNGRVIADRKTILPYTAQIGKASYPFDALERIMAMGHRLTVVDGEDLARRAGEPRAANMALMGALARFLPVPRETWEKTIRANLPGKVVDGNLAAFSLGFASTDGVS